MRRSRAESVVTAHRGRDDRRCIELERVEDVDDQRLREGHERLDVVEALIDGVAEPTTGPVDQHAAEVAEPGG